MPEPPRRILESRIVRKLKINSIKPEFNTVLEKLDEEEPPMALTMKRSNRPVVQSNRKEFGIRSIKDSMEIECPVEEGVPDLEHNTLKYIPNLGQEVARLSNSDKGRHILSSLATLSKRNNILPLPDQRVEQEARHSNQPNQPTIA